MSLRDQLVVALAPCLLSTNEPEDVIRVAQDIANYITFTPGANFGGVVQILQAAVGTGRTFGCAVSIAARIINAPIANTAFVAPRSQGANNQLILALLALLLGL